MDTLKILVVDDESRMRKPEMARRPWIYFIKKKILH